jgi:cyclic pyranopterin phosphate synthase
MPDSKIAQVIKKAVGLGDTKDKEILKNENFCPLPFLQLMMNPLGSVSVCCFSHEYPVGNIKDAKIEQIWNNQQLQEWRRQFLENDIKICKYAIETYKCQNLFKYLNEHVEELSIIQKSMPKRLDVRLNGQCNLECIMCEVWTQPNKLYDSSDFWTLGPEKIFPYLVEIDVLGGEPFVQKDTFRLIDEISKVNDKCKWSFYSNGQYSFNEKFRSYLDKIKIRHIHISLDAINEKTYSVIRKKGELAKSLKTLNDFVSYRNEKKNSGHHFDVFASMCVMKYNYSEIIEFYNYCKERGVKATYQLLNETMQDRECSILTIPDEELTSAITYFESACNLIQNESMLPYILQTLKDRAAAKITV